MICKGCTQETERGTQLTWSNGELRGEFCDDCRDWISKGHRDSPVVYVGRSQTTRQESEGEYRFIYRYYRNDTTGDPYVLVKTLPSAIKPFFTALTFPGGDIEHVGKRVPVNGKEDWGVGFSWDKAERAFIKVLQKEA